MPIEEQSAPDPIDIRSIRCFGWAPHPKQNCWYDMSMTSRTFGWKNVDHDAIESSLAKNVDESYFSVVQVGIVDTDDDTKYLCRFDNQKATWEIEIKDSPKADIQPEQMEKVFQSETFKKTADRAFTVIKRARDEFEQNLRYHLENGEMLDVDVVKLSAILEFLKQDFFLDNLKNGTYVKS